MLIKLILPSATFGGISSGLGVLIYLVCIIQTNLRRRPAYAPVPVESNFFNRVMLQQFISLAAFEPFYGQFPFASLAFIALFLRLVAVA